MKKELSWTTKQPTEQGFYWVRRTVTRYREEGLPTIRFVYKHGDRLYCEGEPLLTYSQAAEWAGPLEEPTTRYRITKWVEPEYTAVCLEPSCVYSITGRSPECIQAEALAHTTATGHETRVTGRPTHYAKVEGEV